MAADWYVTLVYKIFEAETEEDAIAAARADNGRLIHAEAEVWDAA